MTDTRRAFRLNELRRDGWGDRAEAFLDWQDAMDNHVIRKLGVSIHDLPDWDFASAFEDGESPQDAAHRFIADNCGEYGIDPDDLI